jgi:hypothetical protein
MIDGFFYVGDATLSIGKHLAFSSSFACVQEVVFIEQHLVMIAKSL